MKLEARNKLIVISIGLIVLLFLAFHLSFKKAIQEWQLSEELNQQKSSQASLNRELQSLRARSASLLQGLGTLQDLDQSFEESLLHEVGLFASKNHLQVVEFSEVIKGKDQSFSVESIRVKVKGSFKEQLLLLNHLETNYKWGTVASVGFDLKKEIKTQKMQLYQVFYVQKIYEDEA